MNLLQKVKKLKTKTEKIFDWDGN